MALILAADAVEDSTWNFASGLEVQIHTYQDAKILICSVSPVAAPSEASQETTHVWNKRSVDTLVLATTADTLVSINPPILYLDPS